MRKTIAAIAATAAMLSFTASASANPEKHPTEHPKDGEHKGDHKGDAAKLRHHCTAARASINNRKRGCNLREWTAGPSNSPRNRKAEWGGGE